MEDNSHRSSEFCSEGNILSPSDLTPDDPTDSHFPVILSPDPWELDE